MKKLGMLIFAFLTLFTAACGNNGSKNDTNAKLNIYTTIYPLAYFTERIGGKHVDVSSIIPPGADAHTFEPSTKTMVEMTEGDAFVYNKSESDEFSSKVADTLAEEEVPVIDAAKGVIFHPMEEQDFHEDESSHDEHEDHGSLDPHIWLDPILAEQLADNIYNGLVKLKPEAKKDFKENLESLKNDLKELDAAFKEKIANAPKKSFIVSHAAYGYWAERYGLEQIAISGLSPSHEPSQQQIQNIIENAKKENVHYILFEENVNNKVAGMIKREVGAESLTLHNLETLTESDIKKDRDYLSIMKQNIDTLSKALQ
jgi:zinc transport system substrate-binding protein